MLSGEHHFGTAFRQRKEPQKDKHPPVPIPGAFSFWFAGQANRTSVASRPAFWVGVEVFADLLIETILDSLVTCQGLLDLSLQRSQRVARRLVPVRQRLLAPYCAVNDATKVVHRSQALLLNRSCRNPVSQALSDLLVGQAELSQHHDLEAQFGEAGEIA